MKICVAQTRPIKGEIQANIENHIKWISIAASKKADLIFFPELSLTGYEPTLAAGLAIDIHDKRLDDFQTLSNQHNITIGAGAPTVGKPRPYISMVLFQPQKSRQRYSKQYIHADEEPFFVSGNHTPDFDGENQNISLAICYEISIPEHAENASNRSSKIYIASAAKTIAGVEKAIERLSEIAQRYSMTVFLANFVGESEEGECGGNSSVWNQSGERIGHLDDKNEGLLIYSTETNELIILNE